MHFTSVTKFHLSGSIFIKFWVSYGGSSAKDIKLEFVSWGKYWKVWFAQSILHPFCCLITEINRPKIFLQCAFENYELWIFVKLKKFKPVYRHSPNSMLKSLQFNVQFICTQICTWIIRFERELQGWCYSWYKIQTLLSIFKS